MFNLLFVMILSSIPEFLLAQAAAQQPQGPSLFESLIPLLGVLVIMYFLMIRPQQRRARQHQEFISALKPGDEIVTAGGIIGRVKSVADGFVNVEVAGDTVIKVLKSAIEGQSPKAQASAKP